MNNETVVNTPTTFAGERILKRREVTATYGLPSASLYAAIQAGSFPKQIRLSPKSVGWLRSECEKWLEDRIADRDAAGKGVA
jgi:prophage regulatory protein